MIVVVVVVVSGGGGGGGVGFGIGVVDVYAALQSEPIHLLLKCPTHVSFTSCRSRNNKNFSRRRAYREDKDIDFINKKNAHYNRKIERAFKDHVVEIKANLERGTALPD